MEFYNKNGRPIGDTIPVKTKKTLLIGEAGTNNCQLNGAQWTVSIEKITYSPLLCFKKPHFLWKAKSPGFAKGNGKQRGYLGRYGNGKKRISLECGPSYDNITHNVIVILK